MTTIIIIILAVAIILGIYLAKNKNVDEAVVAEGQATKNVEQAVSSAITQEVSAVKADVVNVENIAKTDEQTIVSDVKNAEGTVVSDVKLAESKL